MKAWYYAWNYQQPITLTYGSNVANAHVMLNTTQFGTLYSAGKLMSDCSDLRFTNSTDNGPLTFYTEVCDTTGGNSLVWVQVNLVAPSTTIYMYYGALGVTSTSQTWSGEVVSLFESVPAGWTRLTGMDARFPYGSSTSGTTGGSDTHTQTSTAPSVSGPSANGNSGAGSSYASNIHTHPTSVSSVSTNTVLPSYLNMTFAYRSSFAYLLLPSGSVVMMNGTIPSSDWTQYSPLLNAFPRGAAVYGATGGASTHSHIVTIATLTATTSPTTGNGGSYDLEAHGTHTHAGGSTTSGDGSSLPDWLGVVYVNNTLAQPLQAGMVTMFTTVLPPLGWTRVSALDSRMPYGQNSFGGTGSGAHTHPWSKVSGTPSATTIADPPGTESSSTTHTHTVTGTLQSYTNLPSYYTVIFGQRYASLPSVSFGGEAYVGTTYTTFTTSATVTSMTTSTTMTSLTTTQTTVSTSFTTLTNMPMPGNPSAQYEQVGISLGKWEGSVNQTHTIYGQVTVSAVGTGQFRVSTVRFGAPWITMNQTLNPSCGCYLTINAFAPGQLRFKVSPSLDLNSSLAVVDMAAEAITSTGLPVHASTSLIVHVGTPVTMQLFLGGYTTEQVQLAVTASGSIIGLISLGTYWARKRTGG